MSQHSQRTGATEVDLPHNAWGVAEELPGASTMRLIHFTQKEHLSAPLDIVDGPHLTIAEVCLVYLNSKRVKGFSV